MSSMRSSLFIACFIALLQKVCLGDPKHDKIKAWQDVQEGLTVPEIEMGLVKNPKTGKFWLMV